MWLQCNVLVKGANNPAFPANPEPVFVDSVIDLGVFTRFSFEMRGKYPCVRAIYRHYGPASTRPATPEYEILNIDVDLMAEVLNKEHVTVKVTDKADKPEEPRVEKLKGPSRRVGGRPDIPGVLDRLPRNSRLDLRPPGEVEGA